MLRYFLFSLIFFLLCLQTTRSSYNILDYGALPHQDIVSTQFANQKAFIDATLAANSSQIQKVVIVPSKTFYFMPMRLQDIHNVSFLILGKMSASKSIKHWPKKPSSNYFEDFLSFYDSSNIEIHGGGKIDGRGYHWWLVCILNIQKILPGQNARPHLLRMQKTQKILVHDIVMKNSPQFHFKMSSCYDAQIYNVHILVNTTAQINLLKKFSLEGIIPLFPLNTDGIDPQGARMKFYNLTVQNYDDVVVPKPSSRNDKVECTQDMLIQNCTVVLGVGMSIGSISPGSQVNCIRDIIFRNVYMARPLKGIYIKTNPGNSGTGLVQNITYQNFTMDRPIWWPIYIGPQQMKEPDGDGPGCMLYPYYKKECQTQPLVTIKDIILQKVHIHNSLLYPITIRCDVKNPCENFKFSDVKIDHWRIGQKEKGYVCEYAIIQQKQTSPFLHCVGQSTQNLQKQEQTLTLQDYKNILIEMEKAAEQVGYHEEDDEFDYDYDPAKQFEIQVEE